MIADLWLSFGVIAAICVAGALVRKRMSGGELGYAGALVYAALCAFAALCITLILNSLGLNYGKWDEIGISVLYVCLVPPTNMLKAR